MEQENYLTLMDLEVRWRKTKRLLYYEPHPKQLEFHLSKANIRAIFGGNRSGKTTCGGEEFLFHVTGMYPEWYPEDMRFQGPVIGRIACKDFQKAAGGVIIPFLNEWLDPALIKKITRNPIGVPVKYELKNGSSFDILTYEQSTEQYEGWRGHIFWADEPIPRDKWIATLRGLVDFRGRAWLTLTPLTQPWIYDDIYNSNDPNVFVVTTDIRDNPHLSEDAIKDFEASLTPEEKEARIHGRFLHLTGLIYKEFNPSMHIIEPFQIPKHWTKYFCIDPHPRTPTACLWLAADPHGKLWIYDELWLDSMNLEQIAHAIHAQEQSGVPLIRFIDPAMDKDNELAGGFNTRKELMRYGIFTSRANTDPDLGRNRIKQALLPKFETTAGMEIPLLRVMRNCEQTIYEFTHYIWDEYRRGSDDLDPKQRPKKKNDHFMDCLKYIMNADPHFHNPKENEEGELVYKGEYTKHPTTVYKGQGGTNYHDLVERKAGNF